MAKNDKQSNTIITIKTTVEYNGKSFDSQIKIDAKDIHNLINNRGPVIANKAIQDITNSLYNTTNEKIKEAINVDL